MHEHLLICSLGWTMDGRNSYDRERTIDTVSGRLGALRNYGVKTILDPTTVDLGRNLAFMIQVSKRSGVNVVASTGLYNENRGYPIYFKERGIDEIVEWMVWELTEGMSGTGIRAGAIKVATGPGQVSQNEEKAIRAASRAHRRIGAPIITHTEGGGLGREQLDILEDEGVDLSRVIIGHACGNSDLRYHFDILRRGANIGIDQVGMVNRMPDEIRLGIAQCTIVAGYANQVMLSQDIVGVFYGPPPNSHYVRALMQGRTPLPYTDILTEFIPKLREAGVTERAIETCMADLPRKFFGD